MAKRLFRSGLLVACCLAMAGTALAADLNIQTDLKMAPLGKLNGEPKALIRGDGSTGGGSGGSYANGLAVDSAYWTGGGGFGWGFLGLSITQRLGFWSVRILPF